MLKKVIVLTLVCLLISVNVIATEDTKNMSLEMVLKEIENITNIADNEKRLEAYDDLAIKLGFNIAEMGESNIEENNISSNSFVNVFKGNGIKNTRPFTVNGAWEIEWEAKGDIFQIYLYDSEGTLQGVIANQIGPGKSSSYQPIGGKYYLNVNAMGNWNIKIKEVD